MAGGVNELQEVAAVGYGTARRTSIIGAIASIEPRQIQPIPYANLGKDTDASVALNQLRANRYTGFDATKATETGVALKDAIALQRGLELAFEGHRFFDLKRKGLPVVRNTQLGDLADGTGVIYTKPGLPTGDPNFQLPIPQAESNANPNVKQNPGY